MVPLWVRRHLTVTTFLLQAEDKLSVFMAISLFKSAIGERKKKHELGKTKNKTNKKVWKKQQQNTGRKTCSSNSSRHYYLRLPIPRLDHYPLTRAKKETMFFRYFFLWELWQASSYAPFLEMGRNRRMWRKGTQSLSLTLSSISVSLSISRTRTHLTA